MFNFWNKRNGDTKETPFSKVGIQGDLSESKRFWQELAEAEANGDQWCCKAVKELIKNAGPLFVSISMADKGAVTIIFKHCPSCGKKL